MVSTVLTQQVAGIDCKTKKPPPNSKDLVEGQPPYILYSTPFCCVTCTSLQICQIKKHGKHSSWKLLGMRYNILIARPFCLSQFFSWNPVCVCSMEDLPVEVLQSYKTTGLYRNIPSEEVLDFSSWSEMSIRELLSCF